MEWRSTISASWLPLQLQVTTMPRNPCVLVMEMQTTMPVRCVSCGRRGNYCYYARFLAMGNGNGDDSDAILPPGEIQGFLVLLLWGFGLRQWAMQKEFPYLVPAGCARAHFYYPIGARTMGNGGNGGSH
jgi:hypothetical protein